MYATVEQARAAGATGSDAEVTAALDEARVLVDLFTRQWWEPTAATVVARVGRDGFVPLPYPVRAITSVTPVGSTTALPSTGWEVMEGVRGLQLRTWGADVLVVGAEPWRGGWANLTGVRSVRVVATLGHEVTPPTVTAAAARLAGWISQGGSTPSPGGVDVDEEGNHLVITTGEGVSATLNPVVRTTGLPEVDAALAPLLSVGPVLIS